MARQYEDCGVTRLHVVDLDGAKAKQPCNLRTLEKIASGTSLDVEWGGGIKDASALKSALDAGAGRIICGSIAVDNRDEFTAWLSEFGPSKIILGADVRDGKVATHGWLKDSGLSLEELMGWYLPCGLSQMICTDISKDGMLQGPDFDFYVALKQAFPTVNVTLSGGISGMADIEKAAELGLHSVIVGKAIYEGKISMKEIESWSLRG
jgi:phosphoribosylformimino-5-aminoimidazole carboxamide ribotide isomerase